LSVSNGEAARLLNMSKTTANRAMRELRDKGFIRQVTAGERLGRKAATYAVTFEYQQIPQYMAATHDYRRWSPDKGLENSNAGIDTERKPYLRSVSIPQKREQKALRSA
ncbi:MAG: winged helix-turn-helix domain-containing protein, partial [Pseudomonadota bacterium]